MSFKEQLRDEILPRAVEYYNGGSDINSAIVKAASDFKLNVDQTDRLVETMNTARVIAHYEKNAEDRTANCDIADKTAVRKLLFDDKVEKKASVSHDVYDYSSYESSERNYRSAPVMEKAASAPEKTKSTDGYSKRQIVDHVVKYASELETKRRFAEERLGMAQSLVASRLSKVARSLSAGYEPEERYALFKAACGKYPSAVREIEKLIPQHIVKGASAFARKFRRMNVIDDSPVASMKQAAMQIESDISAISKIAEVVSIVSSKEASVKKLVSDYAVSEKRAATYRPGMPTGSNRPKPNSKKKNDDSKLPTDQKEDPWLGKAVDSSLKASKAGLKYGIPEAPVGVKTIWSYLQGGGITTETIDKALAKSDKKDTDLKNYVDNIVRSDIISDLYANDPVLSEVDPQLLTQAYENLVEIAPQASLKKEVVRAILRQSVNAVAVSPFDAKQWADLDNVLLKNKSKVFSDR